MNNKDLIDLDSRKWRRWNSVKLNEPSFPIWAGLWSALFILRDLLLLTE